MKNNNLNLIAFIIAFILIIFMNGCDSEYLKGKKPMQIIKIYSTDGNVEEYKTKRIKMRAEYLDFNTNDTLTYYRNGDTLRYTILVRKYAR